MNKIVVGTVLRDNDPRQNGRLVTLIAVEGDGRFGFVWYLKPNGQRARLKRSAIHFQSTPRKTGYTFISSPDVHSEGVAA